MKAIITNSQGEILEIITNVRSYTESSIYGDSEIEGLSRPFILVWTG